CLFPIDEPFALERSQAEIPAQRHLAAESKRLAVYEEVEVFDARDLPVQFARELNVVECEGGRRRRWRRWRARSKRRGLLGRGRGRLISRSGFWPDGQLDLLDAHFHTALGGLPGSGNVDVETRLKQHQPRGGSDFIPKKRVGLGRSLQLKLLSRNKTKPLFWLRWRDSQRQETARRQDRL